MNNEQTIELQVPLLLPGVEDQNDSCLVRLETALQNQKGISRAHLEREKVPVNLCLHYDPNQLSIEDVRRLAGQAGAQIVNHYHHLLIPIEGMDCSDCATVIEHSLGRIDGVLAVSVSYVAQTVRVEFDRHKVDRAAIEKRIRSLGYEIPVEGVRSWFKENQESLCKACWPVCSCCWAGWGKPSSGSTRCWPTPSTSPPISWAAGRSPSTPGMPCASGILIPIC